MLPPAVRDKQPVVPRYTPGGIGNRRRYVDIPLAVTEPPALIVPPASGKKPPALTRFTPGGLQTAGGKALPPARWSPAVCKPPGIGQKRPPAVTFFLVVLESTLLALHEDV